MKSATVTLGLFAALTSAYSHPRHMHFRRQNSTEVVSSALSSLASSASSAAGISSYPVVTPPSGTGASSIALSTGVPASLNVNSTASALFPVANSTTSAPAGGLTTLTVIATAVQTITSCAATVPNCPTKSEELAALPTEALSTILVTSTKTIAEVTCPVSEASSIESSILSSASAT
ncbi:hypothetical protein V8F20_000217, partial [Naviculisporaceae sp. PSN 640]